MSLFAPVISPAKVSYQNIRPSHLRLIVLTSCNCNLNCNVNINTIFHKLDIDNTVRTIKLEQHTKGEIKEPKRKQRKKNKNKNREKKKKHFINQITIVLSHMGYSINVKLFGNGKIVVTGAKNSDMIKVMLGILIGKIHDLRTTYRLEANSLSEMFNNSASEFIKYMEKNHILILQLIHELGLDIPINWHNFLINKLRNRLLEKNLSIDDMSKDHLYEEREGAAITVPAPLVPVPQVTAPSVAAPSVAAPSFHNSFVKLLGVSKIVKLYSYSRITNRQLMNDVRRLYDGQEVEFPVTYDSFPDESELKIVVNNYNALFESNVKFDRDKLHHVLTERCQILVNYRPSSYQGLNITYYTNHNDRRSKVTFFAFQDGTIMITGNNDWEVIQKSYYEICSIIDANYYDIVSNEKKVAKCQYLPIKVERTIDDANFIFLNVKAVIVNNPRNNYVLKKRDLMKLYGTDCR